MTENQKIQFFGQNLVKNTLTGCIPANGLNKIGCWSFTPKNIDRYGKKHAKS